MVYTNLFEIKGMGRERFADSYVRPVPKLLKKGG